MRCGMIVTGLACLLAAACGTPSTPKRPILTPKTTTPTTDTGSATGGPNTAMTNDLKRIARAIHNFHDSWMVLPQDIVSKDGKPLLSWRVAVLPYLGESALYRQFTLDEPWDSEHNESLVAQMPKVYAAGGDAAAGLTVLHGFTAPGQAFVKGPKRGFASMTDGMSNTILVAETESPTEWTKPDGVDGAALKYPRRPFLALFADGMVYSVRAGPEFDKGMTIAGGEVIDTDKLIDRSKTKPEPTPRTGPEITTANEPGM